ncbi:hypothetical protein GCK72_020585 [Caenorhabditis remanei]|uniref:Uncharacterized protein n=1 Tax=Caenorhabditis remanei TaxID=31234 RepID=A0A6A5GFM4_CAERE|nr:hypothetical protein GCK72_020585 [Caenorhabditis remanei]KAF1754027.1 hypothetical protein GCK72_020585 [Caenorhabditis remanei]
MSQPSLGADSGCLDFEIPNEKATETTKKNRESGSRSYPELGSVDKGGFGCKYYYLATSMDNWEEEEHSD